MEKEKLQKLKHNEMYLVPESDYGKAEIYRINNTFVVFGIPLYGGEPWYASTFVILNENQKEETIDEVIKMIDSWN